jgi:peptidoglycan/xylan/chitin deacetylase (PgdA/CDA1 family)
MDVIPNLATVDLDGSRTKSRGDMVVCANHLLDAFSQAGTKATFFASNSIIAESADLARRIVNDGHEIACLTHERPAGKKPYCSTFAGQLDATRDAIEQATGVRVRGHRNAGFAIDYESEWTYDLLVDRGFEYDSSRVPSRQVEHGYYPVPRAAHAVRRWGGMLLEIPVSTANVMAMRVRLGAPGTIRGLPLAAWSAIAADRRRHNEPLVMHMRANELTPKTAARAGRIADRLASTSVAHALTQLHRHAPIIDC